MGGSYIDDDWDLTSLSNVPRTIVLFGRTGNGKSATGNSILGRKAFKSKASLSGVTSTSELQSTILKDGQVINVIDTPGLFDISVEPEFLGKEIVKCIDLAKDGIHAILVVFSVRTRFSKEEEAALESLQTFFGPKIADYMIIVFTGGDELEDNEETLEDYLGRECPEQVQKLFYICKHRRVLFDNKTKDGVKKAQQLQQLLDLVDMVIEDNGGRPYTDDLFKELKRGALKLRREEEKVDSLQGYTKREITELKEQMHRSYDDQLKRITEMVVLPGELKPCILSSSPGSSYPFLLPPMGKKVESRLKETTSRLEQQLAVEHAARLKAEEMAQAAQRRSNDEIRKLRENLERAQRETEELRKQASKCAIL